MGKVIADVQGKVKASDTSATFEVENATSSVNYVLSKTDGSANDHLKTDGSGNLAWVTAPSGGLSTFSQWRMYQDYTGAVTPIPSSHLEEVDNPTGFGKKGSSMTESAGVFQFPSTGYWLIKFHILFQGASNSVYNKFKIETTVDHSSGPTWAVACESSGATGAASQEQGQTTEYIFAVTDRTERRCRFVLGPYDNSGTIAKGHSDLNETFFTFMKLADI